jgi:hypothetical protein
MGDTSGSANLAEVIATLFGTYTGLAAEIWAAGQQRHHPL